LFYWSLIKSFFLSFFPDGLSYGALPTFFFFGHTFIRQISLGCGVFGSAGEEDAVLFPLFRL